MKKIIFLIIVCLMQSVFAQDNGFSKELKEIASRMLNDPLMQPVMKEYALNGNDIELYYGHTDLENELLEELLGAMEYINSGKMTSEFSTYSSKIFKAEKLYYENKDSLHPESLFRWLAPSTFGLYHYMNSTEPELALKYVMEADDFVQNLSNGKLNVLHLVDINYIAPILNELKRDDEALKLVCDEIDKMEASGRNDTYSFAYLLFTAGELLAGQDRDADAILFFEEALEVFKDLGIAESYIVVCLKNELAKSYAAIGGEDNIDMAALYLSSALETIDSLEEIEPELRLEVLKSLVYVYIQAETYENIPELIPEILGLASEIITVKIPLMSENARQNYWMSEMSPIYSFLLPLMSWMCEDDAMAYFMYIALLQSRGMQLNCNNYFTELISDSSDKTLNERYKRLLELRTEYNSAKGEFPIDRNKLSALRQKISDVERELLLNLKEKDRNILSWMDVTQEDIQENLKDDELAVEFFSLASEESSYYCALVLNNDPEALPKFVEFFSGTDFRPLASRPEMVADSIWGKIVSLYPKTKRIYFAPCDELNNYPIELCTDSKKLSRDFTAVRLSSTRQLAMKHDSGAEQVVLLGDFNYDLPLSAIVKETESIKNQMIPLSQDLLEADDSGVTDAIFEPLPGTGREIENLKGVLKDWPVSTVKAEKGIESAFKALSGTPYKVIHLATHGYSNNHGNNPNTAMDNCGLVFSGVNTLESLEWIPDFVDDGKLTASEIANMDLRGTDLVCLSACSTGVSSMSAEGAFGLERGFKMAGVNSIMMSLWDIPDEGPTALMMSAFYKYLNETGDKLTSYQKAVKDVRKAYPDFRDWASFIIIDAL